MRTVIVRCALTLGLSLTLCTPLPALAAAVPQPQGNPTPCYGAPQSTSMVFAGTVVYIHLDALATGFYPECEFAYHEYLSPNNGAVLQGTFSIRVWVCGTYEGDIGSTTNFKSTSPSFTSSYFQYQSCGKQADNYKLFFGIGGQYYDVCYQCAGYLNF